MARQTLSLYPPPQWPPRLQRRPWLSLSIADDDHVLISADDHDGSYERRKGPKRVDPLGLASSAVELGAGAGVHGQIDAPENENIPSSALTTTTASVKPLDKPHKCQICFKLFRTTQGLGRHKRSHSPNSNAGGGASSDSGSSSRESEEIDLELRLGMRSVGRKTESQAVDYHGLESPPSSKKLCLSLSL